MDAGLVSSGISLFDSSRDWAFFFAFPLFFVPVLYVLDSLLCGRRVPIERGRVLVYMGLVLLVGLFGEVVVHTGWVKAFGKPLWLYRVWPVHYGYTSGVGVVMWPLYGFHLYALHHAIRTRPALKVFDNDYAKGLILGIDALLMEIAANIFALVGFGTYYFFYLPNDLFHFASAYNFPAYFLCGIVAVKVLNFFSGLPRHRSLLGVLFLALGVAIVHFLLY